MFSLFLFHSLTHSLSFYLFCSSLAFCHYLCYCPHTLFFLFYTVTIHNLWIDSISLSSHLFCNLELDIFPSLPKPSHSLTITLLSKVINPISKYSPNSKHTTNICSQIPQSILPRSFIALQNFYFTSEIRSPSFRTLLGSFLLPCHALSFDWFGFQIQVQVGDVVGTSKTPA